MGLSGMSLADVSLGVWWWEWGWGGGVLGKGAEDKFALGDANVGDLEARVVDLEVLIQEDVKVNVPWSLVDDLFAS